jgi:uncharacterized membrane protein YphA (DoxX/SURF4 family)
MKKISQCYESVINVLNSLAPIIPLFLLRLLLAWEFGESGLEKLHGTNWFADLAFPFPFNLLSPETNWALSWSTRLDIRYCHAIFLTQPHDDYDRRHTKRALA